MGTGKTTVAQIVAEKTRLRFVDMDEEIVALAGMSVPQIFAAEGESGFRAYERQICTTLAADIGQVIATGGGALVDEVNRSLMLANGLVICLNASPDAIRERLGDMAGRPLAPDWEALLLERQPVYAQIPHQIDTTGKSPEQVAEEVNRLWQSLR